MDPQSKVDAEMKLYKEKLKQYAPGADPSDRVPRVRGAVASSFHKTIEAAKCKTREGLRDSMRT